MYYFVPSWYRRNRTWLSYGQIWFLNNGLIHFDFDDSINQIRMFKDEGKPVKILTLGYFPSIGNFLFRHNILDAEIDNIFDQMQGIHEDQVIRSVNYLDFNWPRDCAFVYNGFNILVYREDELYARIRMGVTGNLIQIEFVRLGYKYRTMFFDSRGFLSSILNYDSEGRFQDQFFLNPEGKEVFRSNQDDTITILPAGQANFRKTRYDSMNEMIGEHLDRYLAKHLQPKDTFFIAASRRHDQFLLDRLKDKDCHKVISYYGHRTKFDDPHVFETARQADMVIADSNYIANLMKQNGVKRILQLPPLDTNLSMGESDRERLLKVMFMVGGLPKEILKEAIHQMFNVMEANKLVEINFANYAGFDQFSMIKDLLDQELRKREKTSYQYYFLRSNQSLPEGMEAAAGNENDEEEVKQRVRRINYITIHSDNDLIRLLKPMRLIVDLSTRPEIFLQVVGISTGIPQINRVESAYVDNGKNGLQIGQVTELAGAMRYYLDGLNNWNRAKMYSVNKINNYTGEKIVKELEEAVRSKE